MFRAPSIYDYWRNSKLYKTAIPPETISRNRFQLLLACIHFANNITIEADDRIGKIRPLAEKLNAIFQRAYIPAEDVVIDETLVPWRGRLVFRQFIPNEANKYGIKLFKLCSVSGCTYSFEVYTGQNRDGTKQVGIGNKVCMNLMQSLLDQGRTLFVDNFYTSMNIQGLY